MKTALFWTIGIWASICLIGACGTKPDVIERPLTALAFLFIVVLCVLARFAEED